MRIMSDLLDSTVLQELKKHPPRYFRSDKLDWLNSTIRKVKGGDLPDSLAVLTERLQSGFSHIRAYHGCRPVSIASYKEEGIKASDISALEQEAYRIFPDRSRVEKALREWNKDGDLAYPNHNRGRVFFCVDLRELVEQCGQYLLYGSEFLLCLASAVNGHDVLRRRGSATAIECDVPIGWMPYAFQTELAGELLREICERSCDKRYQPDMFEFGFYIQRTLPPENIVGFLHPSGIPNYHNRNVRED